MSNWITNHDYKTVIRSEVSNMVTDTDDSTRHQAEAAAIQEAKGYLSFGYDVAAIFGHKVYIHDISETYQKHDLVFDGIGTYYVALQDIPIGTDLDDNSFWLIDIGATVQQHNGTAIFGKGDTVAGPHGEEYLVLQTTTGAALTDTGTFYLKRNTLLVMCAVDIALYHLHARIHAKQVPEWRLVRYDDAIKKLKEIRKGNMNPGLPIIAETAAATGEIALTSNTKRNNNWYGNSVHFNPATQ